MITITSDIPGGVRRTLFDDDGTPVSVTDDYGRRGQTVFGPEWADEELVAKMRAGIEAVTEPLRRKSKP